MCFLIDYARSRRDRLRNESAMGRMTIPCVALQRTMTHQCAKKKFRKYSYRANATGTRPKRVVNAPLASAGAMLFHASRDEPVVVE